MTPHDYLEQVVKMNIAEFISNKDDPRRAYNAILSVDALVAHIFHADSRLNFKDDDRYRDHLAEKCSSYALLRDAANAVKHVRLTYRENTRQLSGAEQIRAKPMVIADWKCLAEVERLDASHVVVVPNRGETRPVLALLEDALNFLESQMVVPE